MNNNPIIKGMDYAIEFFEAAIQRLSLFFLLIGFIAATIAFLTSQFDLPNTGWFDIGWASVQACAVDGLFFGVLARFRDCRYKDEPYKKVWLASVALLLGFVACIVSTTITVHGINNETVNQAMSSLGLSVPAFSMARSVIVVIVFALVATLPRAEQDEADQKQDPTAELISQLSTCLVQLSSLNKTSVQEIEPVQQSCSDCSAVLFRPCSDLVQPVQQSCSACSDVLFSPCSDLVQPVQQSCSACSDVLFSPCSDLVQPEHPNTEQAEHPNTEQAEHPNTEQLSCSVDLSNVDLNSLVQTVREKTDRKIILNIPIQSEREIAVRSAIADGPNRTVRSIAGELSIPVSSVHSIIKKIRADQ